MVMIGQWLGKVGLGTVIGLALCAQAAASFDTGRLSFKVRINEVMSHYTEAFTSVMPSGTVVIRLAKDSLSGDFELVSEQRVVSPSAPGTWRWRAPETSGLQALVLHRTDTGETMRIQVFTLVPASQVRNGKLNGYPIGTYPKQPFKGLSAYEAPLGFIEVTEANKSTWVSPHFRLEQFLCKQPGGYPKYLVLRPALLMKLEGLLAEVNENGFRSDSFVIMSGYRTPYYNASIDNVANSRHLWGGAADVYIDVTPKDGRMDDLNGDGRVTKADAMVLYRWSDQFVKKHQRPELRGGVGAYGSTASHGPFVHVDVRGQVARWGHRD
ncbi:D-Ala-D-Ala carboxypeptidase family metallohydrolase [Marinobacter caseinilyticus]|uniref:D-Ala-D-Ala carboxypeptidase family metallohydrolase n=1 Tax=Marinobacter caseinilyticus TaxID=2692195 RepID=UPI00140A7B74|nr:D-Ala-D-Ala carboxypeptidase family metallohydrolase [Marinobacter caseinilyticus]